ncbi:MAG: NYN domain-containing protein [Bradymonadia bacterium]
MLKAGVYVDAENVARCGGWGMRFDILRQFIEAQGVRVLRANVYLAVDQEREEKDWLYRDKKLAYRAVLRRQGYKVVPKFVKRYRNEEGELVTKANADLDLAVDALLQAQRLDYMMLVSGDGDFVRLVNALQNFGCRVDALGFHNVSRALRDAVDTYHSGFFVPELLPTTDDRLRGFMHSVDEEKYFGWITTWGDLSPESVSTDIFVHGNDVEGGTLSNGQFANLKVHQTPIEFTLDVNDEGQPRAVDVKILRP